MCMLWYLSLFGQRMTFVYLLHPVHQQTFFHLHPVHHCARPCTQSMVLFRKFYKQQLELVNGSYNTSGIKSIFYNSRRIWRQQMRFGLNYQKIPTFFANDNNQASRPHKFNNNNTTCRKGKYFFRNQTYSASQNDLLQKKSIKY